MGLAKWPLRRLVVQAFRPVIRPVMVVALASVAVVAAQDTSTDKGEQVQKLLPPYMEKTTKSEGVEILDEKLKGTKSTWESAQEASPAPKPETKKP